MISHPDTINSQTEFLKFLAELQDGDGKIRIRRRPRPSTTTLDAMATWITAYKNIYENTDGQPLTDLYQRL